MNPQLRTTLERIGWEELYERWIPGLAAPNSRGERAARSPFPDEHDNNPSFAFNVTNGLWRCMNCDRSGNYVQFVAIMRATEFDERGRAVPNFRVTEHALMIEHNVVNPVTELYIAEKENYLEAHPQLITRLQETKPWTREVIARYRIGYDAEYDRYVFPIFDALGRIINCKMYRPGGRPKWVWYVTGLHANVLFPIDGYNEQTLLLVEGEPDALSLRALGFAAVTGTDGSSSPIPEGNWYRNKHIYILGDADAAGQHFIEESTRRLHRDVASLHICTLPQWEDRPGNADVSDYIYYLYSLGFQTAGVCDSIVNILNSAEDAPTLNDTYDTEPVVVNYGDSMSSNNIGHRVGYRARLNARSEKTYAIAASYEANCPARGHGYCTLCPMRDSFRGHGIFNIDPRSSDALKQIGVHDDIQHRALLEAQGIPKQCPDVTIQILNAIDIEPAILSAPLDSEITATDRHRYEVYIIPSRTGKLEENMQYDVEGFVYPRPQNQQLVAMLDVARPMSVGIDSFIMTPDIYKDLCVFKPTSHETVIMKLKSVAQDLIDSTTLIRKRLDLHLAYRTIWHSALHFTFLGNIVDHGWLEILVVGDTRTGKSQSYKKMAEHFGVGMFVDCKHQTPAGILGAVEQSAQSGERYVIPGIMPQQDNRAICFDEFTAAKFGRVGLLELLSSTRSDGTVRISKAASAQFRARVRCTWLANPGVGKLIHQLGYNVIEVVPRLVTQPEDIARFDFAMAVAQQDVSVDDLNDMTPPTVPIYGRDISQQLIAWIYSRQSDQITFTPEAEQAVIALSKWMCETYTPTVPLVEPSDQRTKVAKVSVSVAAQCFSASEDGESIIVRPEHVHAAGELFRMWYDKPIMGYDTYSRTKVEHTDIINLQEINRIFEEDMGGRGRDFAAELLRMDEFVERTFTLLAPTQEMFARRTLQQLYLNRGIQIARGRKDAFEITSAFAVWLREYIERPPFEVPQS